MPLPMQSLLFVSRSLLCYIILHDPLMLNYTNFFLQNPSYGNSTIKLTLKWQCKIPLPAFWAFAKKGEAKKWQKECLSAYFSCKKRNPTAMLPQ